MCGNLLVMAMSMMPHLLCLLTIPVRSGTGFRHHFCLGTQAHSSGVYERCIPLEQPRQDEERSVIVHEAVIDVYQCHVLAGLPGDGTGVAHQKHDRRRRSITGWSPSKKIGARGMCVRVKQGTVVDRQSRRNSSRANRVAIEIAARTNPARAGGCRRREDHICGAPSGALVVPGLLCVLD